MKSLLFLLLGAVCGAVATVVLFTVDPNFDGSEADGAGGGNITLVLSEDALGTLVANELENLPAFGEGAVAVVTVGSNGIMVMDITIGGLGVGLRSKLTVNPEIVNGQLKLEVVEARLGELAVPEELAEYLEAPIQERLDSLAGEVQYRVTAIRTTEHRLAIEIEI
jgi:hypothetical protein